MLQVLQFTVTLVTLNCQYHMCDSSMSHEGQFNVTHVTLSVTCMTLNCHVCDYELITCDNELSYT